MSTLLGLIVLFLMIYFHRISKQYSNNFKLIMIIGKKGAGKSSTITALNLKYANKGWTTYSTEHTPDSYHVDPDDIGYYEMEPYSVLFIDEIGLIWHARDFKNFAKEVRAWFKLQRHRKLIVYVFSQSFDIDKSLRDLCDEIWIIKAYFNIFSVRKRINKNIDVASRKDASESGFIDELKCVPWFVPGARKFIYIPKYSKYFDSFSAPKLKEKEFEYVPPKFSVMHFKVQRHLMKLTIVDKKVLIRTKLLTMMYRNGWILLYEKVKGAFRTS